MSITIPSELKQFVDREIASGKFRSHEEVVSEALRLLRNREEKLDRLRSDIQLGIEQLESGEFITIQSPQEQAALLDRIKARGRDELSKQDDAT